MTVVSDIPAKRQRMDAGDGASVDGLKWDHDVNLIGEKVTDADLLNCCQICSMPILTYGRMIPCKHVFCLACANKSPTLCAKCGDKVTRIEECGLGTVFVCSFGAARHAPGGCRRTYLSLRDMDAHVKHRHSKKEALKPQVSAAQVPNLSQPPPGVSSAPTHIPPPSPNHNRVPQPMQMRMPTAPPMQQVSPRSNSNRMSNPGMSMHSTGPMQPGMQGPIPGQMMQQGGMPVVGQIPMQRAQMQPTPQMQRIQMVPGQQITSTGQVMVQGGHQPGQIVQQQGPMVQQQSQLVQQQSQMGRRMAPVSVPPPGMPPVSMSQQQMMPHLNSQHGNMPSGPAAPMRMAGQQTMMPGNRMPPPGNAMARPPPAGAMARPPIQQRPPGPRPTGNNNLISIPIHGASSEAQNTFQRY